MKKCLLVVALIFSGMLLRAQCGNINTIAGTGVRGYSGDDSAATTAALSDPNGIAIDDSGNVYIAEWTGNRIRKVSVTGIITTVAGTGAAAYGGDGGAATAAQLQFPIAVAIDKRGNIYIADGSNNRVRKVDTAGIITTFAGNGTGGYTGDGAAATAASISIPTGIAIDDSGNVLIADGSNYCVRKVNTSGIISTFAGTGTLGFSGDGGPATAATFRAPYGIAIDRVGNVYISDYNDHRIRKVNVSGIISTVAGNGSGTYSGDGGAATAASLKYPKGIAVDASGNLYISDNFNHTIRKVNASGIISTICGIGFSGFGGDGGPATAATIYWPNGVAVDIRESVYFTDYANQRVRKIRGCSTTEVSENTVEITNVSVAPNPTSGDIMLELPASVADAACTVTDLCGRILVSQQVSTNKQTISIANLAPGIYLLSVNTGVSKQVVRIVKE